MILTILFLIVWGIVGQLMFIKINEINNGNINLIKLNLLILISGPLIWILNLYCYIKKAFTLLGRMIK